MVDPAAVGYALLLGVVAAFNPCGFALLPAYVTLLVTGSADAHDPRSVALRRAITFGLAMAAGFMIVFLAFGLLFGVVSLSLQGSVLPYLSWVTAALGVLVIVLGVVMIVRGELRGPGLRISGAAPARTFWSQVLYGATFALASMSCTIGLFLVVVTQALAAPSPVGAVAPFLAYAAGMGTSIVLVSLMAALVGSGFARALRRHTPTLMRIGGVIMVLAGAYVLLFALAEILLRFGVHTLDAVLTTTAQWQGQVTEAIQSWGTPVLIGLLLVAIAAVVVFVVRRQR